MAATTQGQGTTSAVATAREDMVVAVTEAMASRAETAMDREDMEAMAVDMEEMEAGTREEGTVVDAVEGDIRSDELR